MESKMTPPSIAISQQGRLYIEVVGVIPDLLILLHTHFLIHHRSQQPFLRLAAESLCAVSRDQSHAQGY